MRGPVTVRPEAASDRGAVRRVVESAFGQPDEAELVDALRADPAWLPDLALVAVDASGDVRGHLLLTRLHVGGRSALALAPLAVDPAAQRRGIGTLLVQDGLRRAAEAGESLVVVLGEPAYYGRFGFRPAYELGVSGPFLRARDAFQALALAEGAPRGYATYAAAFGIDDAADDVVASRVRYADLVAARPGDAFLTYDVHPDRIERTFLDGSSTLVWTSHHPIRNVRWLTAVGDDPQAVAGRVAEVLAQLREEGTVVSGTTVPVGVADHLAPADRAPSAEEWSWWATEEAPAMRPGESGVVELAPDDGRIDALLAHSSSAYTFTGDDKVRRWAGVVEGEELVACAAHVEHIPGVPHLASVCTRPDRRGRGLASDICARLTREALAGGASVMTLGMYRGNHAAAAVYRALGFRCDKEFASGWLPGMAPPPDADPHEVEAADGGGTA